MADLRIDFVVDSMQFDQNGLLYAQNVCLVNPDQFLEQLLLKKFYDIYGGYCIVIDNNIWNAYTPVAYDPEKVHCPMDAVLMSYLFLESVVLQLEDDRPVRSHLSEMVIAEITFVDPDTLKLVGKTVTGFSIFQESFVSAADFYQQLYRSTLNFISFARILLGHLNKCTNEEAKVILSRNLSLDLWEALSQRLYQIIH
jgi:hypothetical protein